MSKLIICRGLPGSGKSTWAKARVGISQTNSVKRINRDDLRNMLDVGKHSKGNEAAIRDIRDALIMRFLSENKTVISDDTNIPWATVNHLKELGHSLGAEVHIEDFLQVPLQTCIERDKLRENSVGEEVIRRMNNELIPRLQPGMDRGKPGSVDLPHAYLCDLDGTLADCSHRDVYDASTSDKDGIIWPVAKVLKALEATNQILFASGRESKHSEPTRRFLRQLNFHEHPLFMRETGDTRPDEVIKREIYENHIAPRFHVIGVFDDRQKVVRMWRELGLFVFNVGTGREF